MAKTVILAEIPKSPKVPVGVRGGWGVSVPGQGQKASYYEQSQRGISQFNPISLGLAAKRIGKRCRVGVSAGQCHRITWSSFVNRTGGGPAVFFRIFLVDLLQNWFI